MSGKKNMLSEAEIDDLVIAQAGDDAAWGKPVRVRRAKAAAFSLSAELATRAAFFARLHRAANVEAWLERIVQERLDLEEAALAELKRELVAR
jgi:hypothetical protein